MSSGIKHFNYSWPDMTTPSTMLMLDIMQVARNELHVGGKIAVHCHAGLGRTGLVVACILVDVLGLSCEKAIELVRKKRRGSIQTNRQSNFIRDFHGTVTTMRSEFECEVEKTSIGQVCLFIEWPVHLSLSILSLLYSPFLSFLSSLSSPFVFLYFPLSLLPTIIRTQLALRHHRLLFFIPIFHRR